MQEAGYNENDPRMHPTRANTRSWSSTGTALTGILSLFAVVMSAFSLY